MDEFHSKINDIVFQRKSILIPSLIEVLEKACFEFQSLKQ